MSKFAVAYIYAEIQKYDSTEVKDGVVEYTWKGAIVHMFKPPEEGVFHIPQHLGLDIIEAEDETEAFEKLRNKIPYQISVSKMIKLSDKTI